MRVEKQLRKTTELYVYCELADKAQNLPVKDVIEQMEQIRQRVRNKLNTIKKYVGSLREGGLNDR